VVKCCGKFLWDGAETGGNRRWIQSVTAWSSISYSPTDHGFIYQTLSECEITAGREPVSAVLFGAARVLAVADGALYFSEGNYTGAALDGLFAVMPGPDTEFFSAAKAVDGEATGIVESEMETATEEEGAINSAESQENQVKEAAETPGEEVPDCGTPDGCFIAGTQVITAINPDGTYETESIQNVQVGQTVLTRDANNPSAPLEEQTVTATEVHTVYSLREVTFSLANGTTEVIDTTDSHPFYVEGQGWTAAEDLRVGDTLSDPGVQVYNFTVGADHSYFVEQSGQLGMDGVWVHNDCADARELRDNLIRDGEVFNKGDAAAHIVPTGDFSARSLEVQDAVARAQEILEDADIELNDAENGFVSNLANHYGTHTDAYLIEMSSRLEEVAGNPSGILGVLDDLKFDILNTKVWL